MSGGRNVMQTLAEMHGIEVTQDTPRPGEAFVRVHVVDVVQGLGTISLDGDDDGGVSALRRMAEVCTAAADVLEQRKP